MYELANKKLELMGQAVIKLIQFLCDYFRAKQQQSASSYTVIPLCGCSDYGEHIQDLTMLLAYHFV